MLTFRKIILSLFLLFTFNQTLASPTLSYTDTGGKGTPLVLIHAWPTDLRLWTPQQQALRAHFRVISVDLWGFGRSGALNKNVYAMTDYADEIKQLLDQLHIEKAIIGGESMGGYVTLSFLKKYPQHTLGLILSNTRATSDTADERVKKEKLAASVLDGSADLIHDFLPRLFSANIDTTTQEKVKLIMQQQSPTAIAASLLGIAYREDSTTLLSQTALPVLIIAGDKDAVIDPQESRIMHKLAKNSRLIMLENTGHLANLEKPHAWNQAVIAQFTNNNKNLSKL